mmetsp:Transcript_20711/g.57283  ORF Transcript_20711/g.57283 Transcript_20711/m.57283 type:complete len:214 (-) Transcript_20711:1168-1809(-)
MSLQSPGLSTATAPWMSLPSFCCASFDTQPRSPHMPPPFCEVGHSECSLHNLENLSDLNANSSGFLGWFGFRLSSSSSSRSSLSNRRRRASASCRVLVTFLPLTSMAGFWPSWNFTRMCRNRALFVSTTGVPTGLALGFFFGGASAPAPAPAVLPVEPLPPVLGPPAEASSSAAPPPSPLGPPARSQTSTAVHCEEACFSTAFVAISPHAARG